MTIRSIITQVISIIFGLLTFGGLYWWLAYEPADELVKHEPGMSGKPEDASVQDTQSVNIGEHFLQCASLNVGVSGGNWPHFLGPGFDNVWGKDVALTTDWGTDGPNVAWSVDLGEGYAGPAVKNGRVYLLDYDEDRRADTLRCFTLASGKELWRRWYDVEVKRNHGMSRTVPAVTDDYVVTLGPKCHVMCVEAESGDFNWGIDLVKEHGAEVPMWYAGQNPLIDDGVAVLAPAGEHLLMGVNCETGDIVWRTPNPNDWKMSHSSVMPMTIQGREMYVYAADGGVAGIAAEGDRKGELLWSTEAWAPSLMVPSPVRLTDDSIFLTSARGAGGMVLKIEKEGSTFSAEVDGQWNAKEGLSSEQQTPVLYNGHLYTVMAKDAGPRRDQLVCNSVNDLQSFEWKSGKNNKFGLGPFLIADGKLWILSDNGTLTVLQVSPEGYDEIAQTQLFEDAHEAWAPMAVAKGRMLVRDETKLMCLDLTSSNGG